MITKHFILNNPVTKALYPRFLSWLDGQNIQRVLQNRAAQQTAEFVEKNLGEVSAFDSDFELLRHAFSKVSLAEGLILEFGVFAGTTINYIATMTQRRIYGFDSFEGLPEMWRPGFEKGRFALKKLPKVRPNVTLVKGWFCDTLPAFLEGHPGALSFLHVDSDLYSSAETIFRLCEKRIVPGTVIVFDEFFNYPGWLQGEYKAFNEFIARTQLKYEFLGYCQYHEQLALRIV